MNIYKDFLERIDIPTEEEFNEVINNLPPFDSLSNGFEYDPNYYNLAEALFEYGVMGDKYPYAYIDSFDYENKSVTIVDIEDIEQLNELNDFLTSNGWILANYADELKNLTETYENDRIDDEKSNIIDKLRELSIDKLREIYKLCQ